MLKTAAWINGAKNSIVDPVNELSAAVRRHALLLGPAGPLDPTI